MDRDLLMHLPVVLAVARLGGFAAAAAELGMSPSAVSHAIRQVEDRLAVALFARTTRSVTMTEAGAAFVAALSPAFADIEAAFDGLRGRAGRVAGLLRLNVPRVALPMLVTPVLVELSRRHPDLVVDVTCEDGPVDIVAAGFDAGIRLGGMIAQDMVALRLTPPVKAIMVASPAYLAARGEPRALADLAHHNCIGFRRPATGGVYAWEVRNGDQDVELDLSGSIRVNDPAYMKDLALAGAGICYLMQPFAARELAEGSLTWLLPETAIEEPGFFLYYPQRAARAPKLRAFIEAARDVLPR